MPSKNTVFNVDKFNCLHGLLQYTVLEATTGMSLTSANYCEALTILTILEQRVGNKSQTVAKHINILIHVQPVTTLSNIKGHCRLYDLMESNI